MKAVQCQCMILKKDPLVQLGKFRAQCRNPATYNIVVIADDSILEPKGYDYNADTQKVKREVFYCTVHTRMLEDIYSKEWMKTWRLVVTKLAAIR